MESLEDQKRNCMQYFLKLLVEGQEKLETGFGSLYGVYFHL